jgi:hypothetical protein
MNATAERACDWIAVALIVTGFTWLLDQFFFGVAL